MTTHEGEDRTETTVQKRRSDVERVLREYLPAEEFELIFQSLDNLERNPMPPVNERAEIQRLAKDATNLQERLKELSPQSRSTLQWTYACQIEESQGISKESAVLNRPFVQLQLSLSQHIDILHSISTKAVDDMQLYTKQGRPRKVELLLVAKLVADALIRQDQSVSASDDGPLVVILEELIRILDMGTQSAVNTARHIVEHRRHLPGFYPAQQPESTH